MSVRKVIFRFWRDDANMTLRNPTTLGSCMREWRIFLYLLCETESISHLLHSQCESCSVIRLASLVTL